MPANVTYQYTLWYYGYRLSTK